MDFCCGRVEIAASWPIRDLHLEIMRMLSFQKFTLHSLVSFTLLTDNS
jgi:hypothetical protein